MTLAFCTGLSAAEYRVYFGTYTGPKSKGVYLSDFDTRSGQLQAPKLAGEVVNPSWVVIHPNRRFLYAVSELGNDGRSEGGITSFAIDAATGGLKALNKVSSGGGGACHLAIDKTGATIYVANYGSGSVAAFRLNQDGTLGERTALVQHSGSSVDQRRQRGPHAHAVVLSADNRFLFVPDLGLDQILSYRTGTSSLTANDPPFVKIKPGSGPRHFALHPKGKFAYDINEMGSSVTAFAMDKDRGALRELQTLSTLPAGFSGVNNSAEIEVDGSGRFLYASNRGDDGIAVFAVDRKRGTLTSLQRVSTQGKIPRSIKMDPTGQFLFAANQNSDSVVVFRVDRKTGRLTPTGQVVEAPSPVCIQFLPIAGKR